MNKHTWNRDNKFETQGKADSRTNNVNIIPNSTFLPSGSPCTYSSQKRCGDGSCPSRLDMCPEEQLVNQTTVFILITVGMVVIILLIILYCFQKGSLRSSPTRTTDQVTVLPFLHDGDSTSLYIPPPAYEEVVSSSLYPVTPLLRNEQLTSFEEPRTPPPNYDAALYILAHSHNSLCQTKEEPNHPAMRRSICTEVVSSENACTLQSSNPDFI